MVVTGVLDVVTMTDVSIVVKVPVVGIDVVTSSDDMTVTAVLEVVTSTTVVGMIITIPVVCISIPGAVTRMAVTQFFNYEITAIYI